MTPTCGDGARGNRRGRGRARERLRGNCNRAAAARSRRRAQRLLEIRAGTGGDESALFAGDLARMYLALRRAPGLARPVMSEKPASLGGYREWCCASKARRRLGAAFESGGHRVQRVPATEAQGRIHTSACTVAVLPEPTRPRRSSSTRPTCASTPSAPAAPAASTSTRPTARSASRTCPPGSVAECQDDRSQHRTRRRRWRCCRRGCATRNAASAASEGRDARKA